MKMLRCVIAFKLLCVVSMVIGEKKNLKYTFAEEERIGTRIGNVAIDGRLNTSYPTQDLENLRYKILKQKTEVTSKFNIDERKGTMTIASVLNREDVCSLKVECDLNFDVGIYMHDPDLGTYDLKEIIRVILTLTDINDNAPKFPSKEVTLSVLESAPVDHVLLTSLAEDTDTGGNNSIQSYSLEPDYGIFDVTVIKNSIGSSNLGIVIKKHLDRETRDSYNITVTARDGGIPQKSGSVEIFMKVSDVNDNKPHFEISNYNITVPEDVPLKSAILNLSATDLDIGLNGKIFFHFTSRTLSKIKNHFAVNSTTGELYAVKEIDYETDKEFRFWVEVNDFGTPSLSSKASVVLNIEDVNDNAPQIIVNIPSSGKEVLESTGIGTFIAHVSVSDADSGDNGKVTCNVSDDHFELQKFSNFGYFKILIHKGLDRETTPVHYVDITCRDGGEKPLSSSKSFVIRILDANDNPPRFSQTTFLARITENNKIGDFISKVTASDADGVGNNNITYSIPHDPFRLVAVDEYSGRITANKVYDREKMSQVEFWIVAMDTDVPSLNTSARVVVTIEDENDEAPYFRQHHFQFSVYEYQLPDAFVGRLNASDPDISQRFLFSVSDDFKNMTQYFVLDPKSGVVKCAKTMYRQDGERYEFQVVVTDPDDMSSVDTAIVTVYILKDTRKPPVIVFPNPTNHTVHVPYHQPIGTVITVIQAHDGNKTVYNQLSYSVGQGNDQKLFLLDYRSGELFLDRDIVANDSGSHTLLIAVSNANSSILVSYAKLNVIVLSVPGEQGLNQNITIVIVLVCVTVLLAFSVIVIICLMRKVDRDRKRNLKQKSKTLAVLNIDSVEKIPSTRDRNNPDLEKFKWRIRSESSFILEDKPESFVNPYVSNSRLSDASHASSSSTVKKLVQFADEVFLKKLDDTLSELSAEVDSGRGASDEDIHSHRGLHFRHHDSVSSSSSYV